MARQRERERERERITSPNLKLLPRPLPLKRKLISGICLKKGFRVSGHPGMSRIDSNPY